MTMGWSELAERYGCCINSLMFRLLSGPTRETDWKGRRLPQPGSVSSILGWPRDDLL